METDRMLKSKEASFMEADGDIVADLEAKVADLESKLLEASKKRLVEQVNTLNEDTSLQQR